MLLNTGGVSRQPTVPPSALQLEQAERLQQWLAALPASLQALASQAAEQAAALQNRHGFSLRGLEQLLQSQAGKASGGKPTASTTSAAPNSSGTSGGRALSGSLLLTARPPQQEPEERQQYAASVLRSFQAKLQGPGSAVAAAAGTAAGHASQGSRVGGNGTGDAGVAQEVEQLIAAATSPDNLALMWEGWMAWV